MLAKQRPEPCCQPGGPVSARGPPAQAWTAVCVHQQQQLRPQSRGSSPHRTDHRHGTHACAPSHNDAPMHRKQPAAPPCPSPAASLALREAHLRLVAYLALHLGLPRLRAVQVLAVALALTLALLQLVLPRGKRGRV